MKKLVYEFCYRLFGYSVFQKLYQPKVKEHLRTLHPTMEKQEALRTYYARKTADLLPVLLVGICFLLLLYGKEKTESVLQNGYELRRGQYLEDPREVALVISNGREEKNLVYALQSRQFTKQELTEKREQLIKAFETILLGNNTSFAHVTEDLNLQKEYEGYPFRIDWESDDYTLIDSDGSVNTEELKEPKAVLLTAIMSCQEQIWEHSFSVMVYPYVSKEKQQEEVLTDILQDADEKQKTEEVMQLPKEVQGQTVSYHLSDQNTVLIAFLFLPAVFLLLFLAKDRDLEKETEKRSRELVLSYPSFVSKFTLLAGAGMTVPFIFQTMEKEEKNPYLAMELKLFCRDMKNEMLEPALDKFGKRCGSALYLKFCALLIQNVKKGTKDFLPMLREEAASAFLLQKQQVKKAREEAGTKLLFPMVLLLLLVMLLIMIPAFLSFSVS